MATRTSDPHERLRDDVRMLGGILGETLRQREGAELYETVERVRALSKSGRAGSDRDLDAVAGLLRELPVESTVPIARAFSHFLTLANIAEQHHRVRRRRAYQHDPSAPPQRGSCEETFARLMAAGVSADDLHAATASLRIELVLTAHPTTITRRTLIQKHLRIAGALARQDRVDITAPERQEIAELLRREIMAAWETDEIRPRRPTPVDEAIAGLLIFEQTLWDALPRFVRSLDGALRAATGRPLALEAAPIRFGSWMGGDRDGNPTVTPRVTQLACLVARWMAADLYEREIGALRAELSMTVATPELRARAGGAREPYRAVLREVRDRLRATRDQLGRELARADLFQSDVPRLETGRDRDRTDRFRSWSSRCSSATDRSRRPARASSPTAGSPTSCAAPRRSASRWSGSTSGSTPRATPRRSPRSPNTSGSAATASGTRRRGSRTWPAHFASLNRSSRRISCADDEVREVFDTFKALGEINPESLAAYVVSMAQAPSDVLAVEVAPGTVSGAAADRAAVRAR